MSIVGSETNVDVKGGLGIPGYNGEAANLGSNPYNMFTTTTCGSANISTKIEHASSKINCSKVLQMSNVQHLTTCTHWQVVSTAGMPEGMNSAFVSVPQTFFAKLLGSKSCKCLFSCVAGTHVLNQEVFGTVAFIGLSRANTWDLMGLLDCTSLRKTSLAAKKDPRTVAELRSTKTTSNVLNMHSKAFGKEAHEGKGKAKPASVVMSGKAMR